MELSNDSTTSFATSNFDFDQVKLGQDSALVGNLFSNSGLEVGPLSLTGNIELGNNSVVQFNFSNSNSLVAVNGVATLAGSLEIQPSDNFEIVNGDELTLMTFASRVGEFDSISMSGFTVTPLYSNTDLKVRVAANLPSVFGKQIVSKPFNGSTVEKTSVLIPKAEQPVAASLIIATPQLINENTGDTQPRRFEYDPVFNQLTRSTDELGRETLYEIDPNNGNTLSVTQVVGLRDSASDETNDVVTSFTYTARGLVDTVTDALGRITDFDYDEFGRTIKSTFAVGTVDEAFQEFQYDAAGNQTMFWDENGNLTQFEFDEMNRLTKIIEADPDGDGALVSPIAEFDYDQNGNLIEVIDSEQVRTVNEYDSMDRLVAVVDEAGNTTRLEYDGAGNVLKVVDPLGNTVSNEYDARNRLVQTTDAEGGTTQFEYDLDNNMTALIDPVLNRTEFKYDARSRLIEEIDPRLNSTFYKYDAVNNLLEKVDRNERVTKFHYDQLDRLMEETWLSNTETEVNRIDYAYDKVGNLRAVADNSSALNFTYDFRDRVKSVDNSTETDVVEFMLSYQYDDAGNVLSVNDLIDANASSTSDYLYDDLNRLTVASQSGLDVSDSGFGEPSDAAIAPHHHFILQDQLQELQMIELGRLRLLQANVKRCRHAAEAK